MVIKYFLYLFVPVRYEITVSVILKIRGIYIRIAIVISFRMTSFILTRNLPSPTIDVAKKIADALEVSTDAIIFGSDEQIVNNKLNDAELLQLFNKVQQLSDEDISSVKAMRKALVF